MRGRSSARAAPSAQASSARPRRRSSVPPREVDEREEEDPNDVHEVPVEADQPDGRSRAVDASGADPEREPNHHADADEQVQRVKARRAEVEHEEDLGDAAMSREIEIEPGNEMLL